MPNSKLPKPTLPSKVKKPQIKANPASLASPKLPGQNKQSNQAGQVASAAQAASKVPSPSLRQVESNAKDAPKAKLRAPLGMGNRPAKLMSRQNLPKSSAQLGAAGTTGVDKEGAASAQASKKGVTFAKPKSPLQRFLPLIIAGAVIVLVFFVLVSLFGGKKKTADSVSNGDSKSTSKASQIVLNYWGLWEQPAVFQEVIEEFEKENPNIKISYKKQSHKDYRERLQTAIASGNGPDIFRFHASWTPMLGQELSPIPTDIMTAEEYKKIFYPVAATQLKYGGQMIGIPLMYDGLALYYNKEMLKTVNAEPPKTWVELTALANDLKSFSPGSTSKLQRAGLAIGTTSNTEHFSDILALLIFQNLGNPMEPISREVREAIVFYTDFINVHKVWDESLPNSTVAFAREEVAMIFAPSWRAHEIEDMNPDLEFGIAPVPSLGQEKVAWASYWAEGVNTKSEQKQAAWKFLKFLVNKEVMRKMYSAQKQERSFGEIYSRVDMAEELIDDELVYPFLIEAPNATGWYMSSYTFDNGINDQLIKYYQDAVNAVLMGKDVEETLETLDLGVKEVLRQYSKKK
ncbi:MAG: sugar ABC transporter substrate-binding protein [Candidatus Woesebacteria bacterium]|jgi:multiple sugar transport system substrate-binding protein